MLNKIILASKSEVRKDILDKNNIQSIVEPSNVDEDIVKLSLLKENASPEIISKNLAELKANKVSAKIQDKIVLGADSVIDLNGELISKPENREEAMTILKKLNGKPHFLISSVCISKNGSMIWNYTDKAILIMKNFSDTEFPDAGIIISDVLGKVVFTHGIKQSDFMEGKVRISVMDANLDKGVYFLQIKSGDNTKTLKLAIR